MATETRKTQWCGIYVVCENGHYWIMDDNGGKEYCGTRHPSDARLTDFRNEATRRWYSRLDLIRSDKMKRLLTIGLLLLSALTTGCKVYRTSEGVGVIGPNGGHFVCSDNNDCSGF